MLKDGRKSIYVSFPLHMQHRWIICVMMKYLNDLLYVGPLFGNLV